MGEIYEKVHKGVQRSYEVCEILSTKLKEKYDIEKKKKKKNKIKKKKKKKKDSLAQQMLTGCFFPPVPLRGCWNKSVSNSELM